MSIGAPTKLELNISQLALAKLALIGEHQTGMKEVPGSIPTRDNKFIFALPFVSL